MEWPTLLTIMLFFYWPQRSDDRKATELSRAVTKLRDMVKQLLCTLHPCILSPLTLTDRSSHGRLRRLLVACTLPPALLKTCPPSHQPLKGR